MIKKIITIALLTPLMTSPSKGHINAGDAKNIVEATKTAVDIGKDLAPLFKRIASKIKRGISHLHHRQPNDEGTYVNPYGPEKYKATHTTYGRKKYTSPDDDREWRD